MHPARGTIASVPLEPPQAVEPLDRVWRRRRRHAVWMGIAGLVNLNSGLQGDGWWIVSPSWKVVLGVGSLVGAALASVESVQARRVMLAWRNLPADDAQG